MSRRSARIGAMRPRDIPAVIRLWRRTKGVGVGKSDTPARIRSYLKRNPGISSTARVEGELVGAVLCGHDGRRGLMHHLAVDPSCRRRGIGRALVRRSLRRLHKAGIHKCYGLIFSANRRGRAFWKEVGWDFPMLLRIMSGRTSAGP